MHRDPDRSRIAGQGRPGGDHQHGEFDRGDEEHPGGDAQAADHPAFEGRDDVEGSPGQRRGKAGQESEGHRRSPSRRGQTGGLAFTGRLRVAAGGSSPVGRAARPLLHSATGPAPTAAVDPVGM